MEYFMKTVNEISFILYVLQRYEYALLFKSKILKDCKKFKTIVL